MDYGAGGASAMLIAMNLDSWNELPPDVQKGIESLSGAAGAKFMGEKWDQSLVADRQAVIDAGREIISLSPEEEARWAGLVLVSSSSESSITL